MCLCVVHKGGKDPDVCDGVPLSDVFVCNFQRSRGLGLGYAASAGSHVALKQMLCRTHGTFRSPLDTTRPQLIASAFLTKPRYGAKLLYMSDEQWVGLSGLGHITNDIRVGGELLYSVQNKAPGGVCFDADQYKSSIVPRDSCA